MSDPRPAVAFDLATPEGDDRLRRICRTCGFIDYVNPRIVVGTVAHRDGRVLLCRRAIDPRKGFWTLPAGFMEEGESVEDGARREAREEACAELQIDAVLAIYSIPRISQVQIMHRAKLLNEPAPGPESLDVALFTWNEIPWTELAFPSVRWALEHWRATQDMAAFAPFTNPPGTEKLTR
jgi:ADP-ribose pyrophosphatase YjhB (NUDIX family)